MILLPLEVYFILLLTIYHTCLFPPDLPVLFYYKLHAFRLNNKISKKNCEELIFCGKDKSENKSN